MPNEEHWFADARPRARPPALGTLDLRTLDSSFPLSSHRLEGTGLVDLPRKLLTELPRHPRRDLGESFEVHARLVAHAVQDVYEVLGGDVPSSPRSAGVPATTSTEAPKTVAPDSIPTRSHLPDPRWFRLRTHLLGDALQVR